MKARLTLQPGQDGTKKLVEKYGDRLLYIRYRYDPERKRRVKTVELVEEEVPWLPEHGRLLRTTVLGIQVAASEGRLQRQVRQAGGTWDAVHKVWYLPYAQIRELDLEDRIVMAQRPISQNDETI